MAGSTAHLGLRYLIRASGAPEVSTNNVLQAILDADRDVRAAFLDSLSTLVNRDLRRCDIRREAYEVDQTTGKKSYRDFLLDQGGRQRCVIETKVDSALTSDDQAARYLEHLDDDGVLVLVTRAPLVAALAKQARAQLDLDMTVDAGFPAGRSGNRLVVALSWSQLLLGPKDTRGMPFGELVALDQALREISDFVPFTGSVEDVATGQLVHQVVEVARTFCERLAERLSEAQISYESLTVKKSAHDYYAWIVIRGHHFWVGYDTDAWATVPGDPSRLEAGTTASPGSPVWMGRFTGRPGRADAAAVQRRRARLDALGIWQPLHLPLGAPREAVVDSLLEQAIVSIRRISTALHADVTVSPADVGAAEEPRDEEPEDAS